MRTLESLREALPGYARDLQLNLGSVLTASGAPGVANTYLTEFLVDTNVTDILNVAVDFDGYPTSGDLPYCSSSCQNGESTAAPPYAAPSPINSVTITPSVTATSTSSAANERVVTGAGGDPSL